MVESVVRTKKLTHICAVREKCQTEDLNAKKHHAIDVVCGARHRPVAVFCLTTMHNILPRCI